MTEKIPTTFAEFFAREPNLIRLLIHKYKWAPFEEVEARSELEQFATYIATNRPSLIPVMDAIQQLGTTNSRELAEHLGLTRSQMVMHMIYLRKLNQRWHKNKMNYAVLI